MRNPFIEMALVAAMIGGRSIPMSMWTKPEFGTPGKNKHSRHTVAMDKRAALKRRNRRRQA